MKAQKSVFGKIVQVEGKFLFEDSAGKQFLIPEFNEEGTNLFKRVRQSFKRPDKYGFKVRVCLLYTSPSPRDRQKSRMPSSA